MSTGCCPYTINDPERVGPFGFEPFWGVPWAGGDGNHHIEIFEEEVGYTADWLGGPVPPEARFLVHTTVLEGREAVLGADEFDTTGTITLIQTIDAETSEISGEASGMLSIGEGALTLTYSWNGYGFVREMIPLFGIDPFFAYTQRTTLSNRAPWHVRFLPPSHCYLKLFFGGTTWTWTPPSHHGLCIPEDFDFDDRETWPRTPDFTDEHEGEMKWSFSANYTPTGEDQNGLPLRAPPL